MNLKAERIYVAHREGLRARLAQQERLGQARAEALIAGWEAEAELIGLERDADDYWPLARRWIAEERIGPQNDGPSDPPEGPLPV